MDTINNNAKFVNRITITFPTANDIELVVKKPMSTVEIVKQMKEAVADLAYMCGEEDESKDS
jgi:hypothetical protein